MLRYQKNTGKVKEDNKAGIKLYLLNKRGITERISPLAKRFNIKVVNTNATSLKQRMITDIMNERNKMEIQGVVYKVKKIKIMIKIIKIIEMVKVQFLDCRVISKTQVT